MIIGMNAFRALGDCVRAARVYLTDAPGGGFDALFGWMARRIAARAGLEPLRRLPGFRAPSPALPAPLEERLERAGEAGAWDHEESLGWAYQLWNAPRKLQAFERLYRHNHKISAGDLPAATQLFTPRWLADFLIQNSLGRLWLEMHPDSRLAETMPLLLPVDGQPRAPRPLREITLFDPACGTMHFGLAALPLLEAMYREEQACAGQPGWPAKASIRAGEHPAEAALACNLYGADIDPLALRLARAALAIRAARGAGETSALPDAHLELAPPPLGSLRRAQGEPQYDCVVANPPYMIARNMPPELAAFLRAAYPEGRRDLYAAFILRALERVRPGGFAGLLTQQSFFHLRSFGGLRARVLEQASLETAAQIGPGAIPGAGGEKINPAAFVLRREAPAPRGRTACIRVESVKGAAGKQAALAQAADTLRRGTPDGSRACWQHQSALNEPPGQPWVLWAPPGVRRALRQLHTAREMPGTDGHKTGDNARFIRVRRDLPPHDAANGRWRTLARPAQQIPFRQQFDQVVDWSPEARAFYRANPASSPLPEALAGRPGICWSRVATRRFNARRFPAGVIPDVSTPAIYPAEEDSAYLVALLNSKPARCLLRALNPTINYALGDVRRLPLPDATPEQKQRLAALALEAEAAAAAWDGPHGAAARALAAIEAEIDRAAYALYEFSEEEIAWMENEIQP